MTLTLAILIAALGGTALFAACRFWFTRIQRPRERRKIGIEALDTRRWRETLDLLVTGLAPQGIRQTSEGTSSTGAPLPERHLERGGRSILLIYKHGTSYRIGPPAILDAERRRQEAELDEVMIATLGSIEPEGRAHAERMQVTCLDAEAVWTLVEPSLDATVREGVDVEAETNIQRPMQLATLGSVVFAFALLVWAGAIDPTGGDANAEAVDRATLLPESPAPRPADATAVEPPLAVVPEGAAADVRPEPLGTEVLPVERAALARALTAIPEVERAAWSSNSTITLYLRPRIDVDRGIALACELGSAHPVLRDVRLQIESPGNDPRWWRCT